MFLTAIHRPMVATALLNQPKIDVYAETVDDTVSDGPTCIEFFASERTEHVGLS